MSPYRFICLVCYSVFFLVFTLSLFFAPGTGITIGLCVGAITVIIFGIISHLVNKYGG